MHLQDVGAILQLIFDPLRRSRKFSGLAHRNEPRAQRVSDRRRKDEAAGFDPDHGIDPLAVVAVAQPVDDGLQPLRILQQRGDVIEQDAGLGEIRHLADQTFEMIHGRSFNSTIGASAKAVPTALL